MNSRKEKLLEFLKEQRQLKRIDEDRTLSRQRKYQLKNRVLGLCYLCPNKTHKWGLCKKHYEDKLNRDKIHRYTKRYREKRKILLKEKTKDLFNNIKKK